MRCISMLFALCLVFGFFACNDDPDIDPFLGAWSGTLLCGSDNTDIELVITQGTNDDAIINVDSEIQLTGHVEDDQIRIPEQEVVDTGNGELLTTSGSLRTTQDQLSVALHITNGSEQMNCSGVLAR